MAILFRDESKHCPYCGSVELVHEKVNSYKLDPKESGTYIPEHLYDQLRCASCGKVVFKTGALDKILDT
jgi:DNA-directed RNA polymerase subunit RPC12/RpoP